ncbi:NAD(P)H-dependent glycerol-3-phosphate dehydrogenase [Sphingomonas aerophila]|jgi:glycerol-3-phosphate dehydrogenase (NAD(P)+)|uniref:Glycerol-3-phosphate dehydrogenase n=1 Tax=Sphingomonas aerophila TaxID=1344948 RepID=A0A7W9BF56_9SPHN|nr:NAD(P)H-dependent glycerol-3-phosphate dehydrogenase [Sphingomonas aerophila]MBB5716052.1 glycerol-3-phosphate dehydrogenase (NAD(P)+) [Sphingomonas aerophila]
MTSPVNNADIAVLGAGSFGTAIATALARGGNRVRLLSRTAEQAEAINTTRENSRFFPGHTLNPLISATASLDEVLGARVLFLAFPSKVMDGYATQIGAGAAPGTVVVNLIKGLHPDHFTFAELFRHVAPDVSYVALKGPTFSRPLFLGEWSGMTCGADDPAVGKRVTDLFGGGALALDAIPSAASVDIASALKNVYAIALGLVGSTGPSENTTYMAATLVIKELRRVLDAMGCHPDVLWSFSGVGDILLTGLCDTSRNRTIGLMMGKGIPIDLVRSDFVAEGVRAVDALEAHCGHVDTPLLDAVAEVLHGRQGPAHIFEQFTR